MSEAAPMCQARQLAWQTHLIFHLVEGLWTWGPSGQALLALYHAGGTWLSSTPQESALTPRGRKWKTSVVVPGTVP